MRSQSVFVANQQLETWPNFTGYAVVMASCVLLLAVTAPPAAAQAQYGDTASRISATPAARYARYYAPYAIQAAAAYSLVKDFDSTRGPSNEPPLDGADVSLAVASLTADEQISAAATKYMRAWQYQFGSEGYLTCFESDPQCLAMIRRDRYTVAINGGPAFQVWGRSRATQKAGAGCSEVSIAFRGSTVAAADWISNLDPVTGYFADNHYRQLRRNIDAILKKITKLDCYRKARTQIVSVGHSLGGGLAQFAAIANSPTRPRITKVFAFDSSPITGASYIDADIRSQNADVEVDLVYQNGEALERLRDLPQRVRRLLRRPEVVSPCARTVEYGLSLPAGAVALHNMPALGRGLIAVSYDEDGQRPYRLPKKHANCPGQYQAPTTDEDPDPASISTIERPATPSVRTTDASRQLRRDAKPRPKVVMASSRR